MMRAFSAEWVRLRRPGQMLGGWGPMVGIGILLAALLVANAHACHPTVDPQHPPTDPCPMPKANQAPVIPDFLVSARDGSVFAFQGMGQLLGIIALVLAASNMATEYTSGTLKVMLVREPRRWAFLGGKVLALWSFAWIGVALTLVLSSAASAIVATSKGIDISAWWTGPGLHDAAFAFLRVGGATMAWMVLGTTLAIVLRSGFAAIGIGIAYPLVVEGLLTLVMPQVTKWMPGAVLGRVAQGDTAQVLNQGSGFEVQTVSHDAAILMAVMYGAVFLAASLLILRRRDVV